VAEIEAVYLPILKRLISVNSQATEVLPLETLKTSRTVGVVLMHRNSSALYDPRLRYCGSSPTWQIAGAKDKRGH
jgi:hypothetical protein